MQCFHASVWRCVQQPVRRRGRGLTTIAAEVVDGANKQAHLTIANPTELFTKIAQRLDRKADKLYEGRPVFSDVDFSTAPLEEATMVADFSRGTSCTTSHLTVSVHGKDVIVTYTNDVRCVNDWIRRHIYENGVSVIGLDTEQRPSFYTKHKSGVLQKKKGIAATAMAAATAGSCAVVQLATPTEVLVIHLAHLYMDTISQTGSGSHKDLDNKHPIGFYATGAPVQFLRLLQDPKILFVGVNVGNDLQTVLRHLRLQGPDRSTSIVDVDKLARGSGVRRAGPGMCHGLESLAHKLLGFPRWKTGALSLSNWSHRPLSQRQLRYAAMDAWAGYMLYEYLMDNCVGKFVIEEAQKTESCYNYLLLHDVAMLPPGKAVSLAWLRKRHIMIEDYGTSVLCKSPYQRTRTGRLVLPTSQELQHLQMNAPLLVPTFRTKTPTTTPNQGQTADVGDATPRVSVSNNLVPEDNTNTDVGTSPESEFWHSDRLHPGIKLLLEELDV